MVCARKNKKKAEKNQVQKLPNTFVSLNTMHAYILYGRESENRIDVSSVRISMWFVYKMRRFSQLPV